MTLKIRVYSDFVCPFCYIGDSQLKEAIKGKDVELEWMPFELRPVPVEPLSVKTSYIQDGWKFSVKPMAERFGVKMTLPDIDPIPRTHLPHEGFQFAKEYGKADEYVDAVFQAYWVHEKDISDINVLGNIAEAIGLNKDAFIEALHNRTYAPTHKDALKHAYEEAQVTAVPTFFIGDQKIQGVHTKEQLVQLINEKVSIQPTGDSCSVDGC